MDLKDMIKWLFQARSGSGTVKSARVFENCSKMCISIIFVVIFAICFTDCKGQVSNNTEIRDHLKEIHNSSDVKINSSGDGQDLKSVFKVDIDKSEELQVAARLFTMIRNGARYLDRTLEDNERKETSRTFGRPIKKLQAMMIPLMFKLGVMATLIVLTFLLSVKAVLIGKILLILKMGAVLAKFFALKEHSQHSYHHGWDQQKQVHLHVHNAPSAHDSIGPLSSYGIPTAVYGSSVSSAWSRGDPPVQEAYSSGQEPNPSRQQPYSARQEPYPFRREPYHSRQEPHLARPDVQGLHGPAVINTPYGQYTRTGNPTGSGL